MQGSGNHKAIREAIKRSVNGQSGLNVYARVWNPQAKVPPNFMDIRIIAFQVKRGLEYAKNLNDGKWYVITQWEER